MSRAVSTEVLARGSTWFPQLVHAGSRDRMALYIVRSDEGWELRSGTGRGIIFSSYTAAIELARTWTEDGHPVVGPPKQLAAVRRASA